MLAHTFASLRKQQLVLALGDTELSDCLQVRVRLPLWVFAESCVSSHGVTGLCR
jgi:hypothetical protein